MAANLESDEILLEIPGGVRAYKDGRLERLTGQDFIPPSQDPKTQVQSKDITISPEINLSARLFLPPNPTGKIPLLVYFHGGGFVVESPFSPLYHPHLNSLVSQAKVVAVSVNYRLAPENPIPVAFDDSWLALKWVASQFTGNTGEEWIRTHADPTRVYLGGDSAGASIAHQMAIRVGLEKLDGINLSGVFMNCPFFAGEELIGAEGEDRFKAVKNIMGSLWALALPGLSGLDEPWINPSKDKNLGRFGCEKLLVYVAEKDYLKDRGWHYKEALVESGWVGNVEVVEVEGEDHVFSVFYPEGEKGLAMLRKVASFINGDS